MGMLQNLECKGLQFVEHDHKLKTLDIFWYD